MTFECRFCSRLIKSKTLYSIRNHIETKKCKLKYKELIELEFYILSQIMNRNIINIIFKYFSDLFFFDAYRNFMQQDKNTLFMGREEYSCLLDYKEYENNYLKGVISQDLDQLRYIETYRLWNFGNSYIHNLTMKMCYCSKCKKQYMSIEGYKKHLKTNKHLK